MLYEKITKSWDELTVNSKSSGNTWNCGPYPPLPPTAAFSEPLEYIKNCTALEEECDGNCVSFKDFKSAE